MLYRSVMGRILVVGAGITGALTASLLRQQLPRDATISVWDKSKGAGGRMSTSRSPHDSNCTVDLGAQYITSTAQDYAAHKTLYEELQSAGIFKEFTEQLENDRFAVPGSTHFVTPKGISSLVKYFLNKSGSQVGYDKQITELSGFEGKWKVTTSQGYSEVFDAVVLTMPVPQILQLAGSVPDILNSQADIKRKLEKVEYSSRFALGVFFNKDTQLDIPWTAMYLDKDPCLRFVSVDSKKRQAEGEIVPSIVAHAHVPFSLRHLEEDKEEVCRQYLLPRLCELLPQLPKPAALKCHKWRYSQVHKYVEGQPEALILNQSPLLICAGDAFSHSTFDGCVKSATTTTKILVQSYL